MKNKISITLFTCLVLVSCSKYKADDPLTIPPMFNIVPENANDESVNGSKEDGDIEELKDLLLE